MLLRMIEKEICCVRRGIEGDSGRRTHSEPLENSSREEEELRSGDALAHAFPLA